MKLLKKLIKSFYNNVNANKITNNKSFWNVNNDEKSSEESKLAEISSNYFENIMEISNIQ